MCDTFVSIVPGKKVHSVILGKNSDREPNEAQILEFHPAQSYSTKEKVHCTYISIPQVRETRAVLLCRPFWMWGAEMGANEKGVAIGNEAVFTKMPYKESGGLTGMDILRLALERADSASQALEVMIGLLADYGQGGNCGFQNKKLVYHNSYIIADAKEAWVLETAGEVWAALKVKDHYAISNGLTIGSAFDRSHPRLIETAKRRKFLKNGKEFHFAECYSDWLYTRFSESAHRQSCTLGMLPNLAESGDIANAFAILRNHGLEPYNPASHLLQKSICAHAANGITRNAGTTGSMVAHLRQDDDSLYWMTATAAPCTSIFKPVWMEGAVLPDLGPMPKGQFNSKSYWWYHERLHRAMLIDFSILEKYVPDRNNLQDSMIKYAYRLNVKERYDFTCGAFKESRDLAKKWWHQLRENLPKLDRSKSGLFYRRYWNHQNKKAELYF